LSREESLDDNARSNGSPYSRAGSMNLLILTPQDDLADGVCTITDDRADHIRKILKLVAGDSIRVGLLSGPAGTALIEEVFDRRVVLRCGEMTEIAPPIVEIDIVCAVPRPQTLKKVLITAAGMGVRRLHLLRTRRVDKSYLQSKVLNPERYRPLLIEGLAQGKLTRLPEVTLHPRFRPFIEDELPGLVAETEGTHLLLPDQSGEARLDGVLDKSVRRLIIAIGPEGGWVPFEIKKLERAGFTTFSLGPWTLRVETALAAVLSQAELVVGER